MGIDIKWLRPNDDGSPSSVFASCASRGSDVDLHDVLKQYHEVGRRKKEYQESRAKVKRLQEFLREECNDRQTYKAQLIKAKAQSKQIQDILSRQEALLNDKRLLIPNTVDSNYVEYDCSTEPPVFPVVSETRSSQDMAKEYFTARFPFIDPHDAIEDNTLLKKFRNKWFENNKFLPTGLVGGVPSSTIELQVLCQERDMISLFSLLVKGAVELSRLSTDVIVVDNVEPTELLHRESRAVLLKDKDKVVGRISSTTDFETREFGIRFGPRKLLQEWKQHAFLVRLHLQAKPMVSASFKHLQPFSIAPPAPTLASTGQVNSIHTIEDAVQLEWWLRTNSYATGAFQTDLDNVLLRQLEASSLTLPGVQYPSINRWISTIRG